MAVRTIRDTSFKLIFGDHELFAAFLKDFVPIPALKAVEPGDIEDISERFLPLAQNHRDSDTVKRIRLEGSPPLLVIAIVEHESRVNYRAPFKMLQYISLVLDAYEKDAEREHPGISAGRDFRYPPVVPVIFYDGKSPWRAARNFKDRTAGGELFSRYIPQFEYELVELNRYSVEALTRFQDALSFIMIIDRIRDREGIKVLGELPAEYVESLGLRIPPGLRKLIKDVLGALLGRLEVPAEVIGTVRNMIEREEYGSMFEELVANVRAENRRLRREGRVKGRSEGRKEAREKAYRETLEAARKLKARGVAEGIIAESLGLSRDLLEGL
jgi:hypothetical protein